jgi:hypothetical protein
MHGSGVITGDDYIKWDENMNDNMAKKHGVKEGNDNIE